MSSSNDVSDDEKLPALADLQQWTVKKLKDYCKKKNLNISGTKEILSKRVHRHITYAVSEDSVSDTESIGVETAEHVESAPDMWEQADTDNLPEVRETDIKNHFIFKKNPCSGTKRDFKRQLIKARKMSNEAYIANIEVGWNPAEVVFVRAKCRASMKDTSYNISVQIIKETGMIYKAECSCKAGQSAACAHIGALLFTIVKCKQACTSQLCTWKIPAGDGSKNQVAQFAEITIHKSEKDAVMKQKPYPGVYAAGPQADSDAFLEDLLKSMENCNADCALYRLLRSDVGDISSFVDVFTPTFSYHDKVDLKDKWVQDEFESFVKHLVIPTETAQNLERSTRGQGVNPNWSKARSYIITASNMGSICRRQKEEPDNLVKHICYPQPLKGVKSLTYGNKMESRARQSYMCWHIKQCGPSVSVEDQGLRVNPTIPFVGASVDGLVMCEKCGSGLVEIKCPYGTKKQKWRNMLPIDCANSAEFCCLVKNNAIELKPNHNYMYQIQGQLAVCDTAWVDFVIWTRKGLSVQRIKRDTILWTEIMLPKLKSFYIKGVLPELFTSRVKRGLKLY